MTETTEAAPPPGAGIQPAGQAPPPSELDPRRWLALGSVMTALFMVLLDVSIVNVAIPAIRSNLEANNADIQFVIAGYGLAYAVLLITGGRLGDIFGRKKLFIIGMSGFVIASALCGLAQSAIMLDLSRVLQGAMAAMMYPQVLSVIQVTFPPSGARPCVRVCRRRDRHRDHHRPARRWPDHSRRHHRRIVAVDLPREPADRHRVAHRGDAADQRVARAERDATRPRRIRALDRRDPPARVSARRRPGGRLACLDVHLHGHQPIRAARIRPVRAVAAVDEVPAGAALAVPHQVLQCRRGHLRGLHRRHPRLLLHLQPDAPGRVWVSARSTRA